MLTLAIAGIGETLHKFDKLVCEGIIRKPTESDQKLDEYWSFIESDEIKEIKKTNLKYMRVKSSFHFDPDPIKEFLIDAKKEKIELDL